MLDKCKYCPCKDFCSEYLMFFGVRPCEDKECEDIGSASVREMKEQNGEY